MKLETLQSISLAVAQERDLDAVLCKIVQGLVGDVGIALARIWLIGPADHCSQCRLQPSCLDKRACLRLMASAGKPLHSPGEDWSRLNGEFCRIPLGLGKIGAVGAMGEPVLVSDVSLNWTTRQEFAQREGIRSFAAQPLIFRGDILGVLAIFSRTYLEEQNFLWLRTFADHAAVALAHSRAFEENARLRERLELENAYLREEVQNRFIDNEMIGNSLALKRVRETIAMVAPTEASVLIQGESGTGKELVARAIHNGSQRRENALIRVNCASIPRELFESEFFGHAKGAFTGALRHRAGRFQLADGGTLFLDEVGEIPLELQGKLLRVLQEGQYERIGEDLTRQVHVRIIAATNRDLHAEVKRGSFREDLFYRLSVFPLEIPPLRFRKEDIGLLAAHLIRLTCRRLKLPEFPLDDRQIAQLCEYHWPGNVRELQNVIERAVIMCSDGYLRFDDLSGGRTVETAVPLPPTAPVDSFLTEEKWIDLERENLLAVLRRAGGRVGGPGGAAELLGLRPTTLRSRLKARDIRPSK
ncbi:MAG: sigma 54-interacting transcriptional regulator [Acidobacteriaceae bacterium]|nr:sigma 54-interacting transcriptional regulator [Acidobacteriaceae bacterium]MBV9225833.1 sigma 54-interacting transcriptional regulator [Acidobacteriaceae bacterium]MBV9308198.1 sigma 54-interacting transcriptional regulator [Acidobacteriaceae bacterium]